MDRSEHDCRRGDALHRGHFCGEVGAIIEVDKWTWVKIRTVKGARYAGTAKPFNLYVMMGSNSFGALGC